MGGRKGSGSERAMAEVVVCAHGPRGGGGAAGGGEGGGAAEGKMPGPFLPCVAAWPGQADPHPATARPPLPPSPPPPMPQAQANSTPHICRLLPRGHSLAPAPGPCPGPPS